MVADSPWDGQHHARPSALSDSALVIAILGGLGAACSWAVATLSSTRSSRSIGARSNLAWVMFVGAVVAVVPGLVARPTVNVGPADVAVLLVSGALYLAGLLISYQALIVGRVSIVAPIVATEGSIAAIVSILLGESLSLPVGLTLAAIAVGVILAAYEREADRATRVRADREDPARAVLLAVVGAAFFGLGLVATARAGAVFPVAWVVLSSRLLGVALIALPLAVTGRLRLTREAAPFVVAAGIGEVLGTVMFVLGAHQAVAIASVVASQFAALVAIGGYLLFGERLARVQLAGILLILAGVATLAGLRA